jgi:hypothetical protein
VRLSALSVLLRLEQASLAPKSPYHSTPAQTRTTRSMVQPDAPLVITQQNLAARSRQWSIPSPLCRFGIHQRKVVRYIDAAGKQTDSSHHTANKVISETYETSWTVLGYGFHWSSQQYPYGSILPSLRVFPIVEDITKYEDLIFKGTLQEVQQAFTSGIVHPFTTSATGCTLLHVS